MRSALVLSWILGIVSCGFSSETHLFPEEKARKIKLIALDVDGVLTQGEVIYSSSGEELKIFSIKDGLGLVLAGQNNFITAIITGRESPLVARRAKELHVQHLYQNVKDKAKIIQELAAEILSNVVDRAF